MTLPRRTVAIALLAVFGVAKLPVESALDARQKQAGLRKTALNLDLREQIGQMGFLAALSGFRSALAAVLWIEAHSAWERTEWGRMAALFNTVTVLQPRSMTYWDMAAWHMAWNASVAAEQDETQPSEALRLRNKNQYIDLGKAYLERGLNNNPDSYFLYERMGILLRDKYDDTCGAADAFLLGSKFPDAPAYLHRFAGYMMAKCPGREKEAYEILRQLYEEGDKQRLPTLLTTLQELEEKLGTPEDQRIQPPPPPPSSAPLPPGEMPPPAPAPPSQT